MGAKSEADIYGFHHEFLKNEIHRQGKDIKWLARETGIKANQMKLILGGECRAKTNITKKIKEALGLKRSQVSFKVGE